MSEIELENREQVRHLDGVNTMALFQQQTLQLVLEQLDIESVLALKQVNKVLHKLITDEHLWINFILRDFGYYRKPLIQSKDAFHQYKINKLKRDISITNKYNYILLRKATWQKFVNVYSSKVVPADQIISLKQRQLYCLLFQMLRDDPDIMWRADSLLNCNETSELLGFFFGFDLFQNQYSELEEYDLLSTLKVTLRHEFSLDIPYFLRLPRLSAKLLNAIGRRAGAISYLREVVIPTIQVCKEVTLEIDPQKIVANSDNANLQDLIAKRVTIISREIDNILTRMEGTVEQIPYSIRWICKHIYDESMKKGAEKPLVQVAAFFVLRFWVPTIVEPSQLFCENISSHTRRSCLVLAQVLSLIANGGTFSQKEPYMLVLNPVISGNIPRFQNFLAKVIDVEDFGRKQMLAKYRQDKASHRTIYTYPGELLMLQQHLNACYNLRDESKNSDGPLWELLSEFNLLSSKVSDDQKIVPFALKLDYKRYKEQEQVSAELLYNSTKTLMNEVLSALHLESDNVSVKTLIEMMQDSVQKHQDLAEHVATIQNNCNIMVARGLLLEEDGYELLRQDIYQELAEYERFVQREYDDPARLSKILNNAVEHNKWLRENREESPPTTVNAPPASQPASNENPSLKAPPKSALKSFLVPLP